MMRLTACEMVSFLLLLLLPLPSLQVDEEEFLLTSAVSELEMLLGETKVINFMLSARNKDGSAGGGGENFPHKHNFTEFIEFITMDGTREDVINCQVEDSILAATMKKVPLTSSGPKNEKLKLRQEYHQLNNFSVQVRAKNLGTVLLVVNSSKVMMDSSSSMISVRVERSEMLSRLSCAFGWIYFLSWSASFYPQIVTNFWRESVRGLNMDYVVWNAIGFVCYGFFNFCLYFSRNVQAQYRGTYHAVLIPVEINDVIFTAHGMAASLFIALQCLQYERGNQPGVSFLCQVLVLVFLGALFLLLLLKLLYIITVLNFLTVLSCFKLVISLCKYFPQALFNYRRKSTLGWSIGNIMLDFIGGVFCLGQILVEAINNSDWSSLTGDPTKIGLSVFSILFDVFFMVQHFWLYIDNTGYDQIV